MDKKKLRSYNITKSYADKANYSLLEELNTYTSGAQRRRNVRCNKCNTEFTALLRSTGVTPCPICKGKLVRDLQASYIRTKKLLEDKDIELLIKEDGWEGTKRGDVEITYPARCKKCGLEYKANTVPSRITSCPNCIQKVTNNKQVTYRKFIDLLKENNLTPLFEFKDWKGVSYGQPSGSHKERSYLVRCLGCGMEFKSQRKSKGRIVGCPQCSKDRSNTDNKYLIFCEDLKKSGLKPMFTREEFTGMHKRDEEGKLKRILYPVRCQRCGEVFNTKRTSNRENVMLCQCVLQKNIYKSYRETQVAEYIREKGFKVIQADRRVLGNGQELDIYLPEEKIAFEINGMFFHSDHGKNPSTKDVNYHVNKTNLALSAGIKCYHLWEDLTDDGMFYIIGCALGMQYDYEAQKEIDKAVQYGLYMNSRVVEIEVDRDTCPCPFENIYTENDFEFIGFDEPKQWYYTQTEILVDGVPTTGRFSVYADFDRSIKNVWKITNSGTLKYSRTLRAY